MLRLRRTLPGFFFPITYDESDFPHGTGLPRFSALSDGYSSHSLPADRARLLEQDAADVP
jgi:hypothetical protein